MKVIRVAIRHSIHQVGFVTELEAHGEVISSIAPAYRQQVVLPPIGLLGFIRRQMLPAMYPHYRRSFYEATNW